MNNLPDSGYIIKECIKAVTEDMSVNYTLFGVQSDSVTAYSVKVSIIGSDESATVNDVTSSEETADRFYRMIVDGRVTPCTLQCITEDLIALLPDEWNPCRIE